LSILTLKAPSEYSEYGRFVDFTHTQKFTTCLKIFPKSSWVVGLLRLPDASQFLPQISKSPHSSLFACMGIFRYGSVGGKILKYGYNRGLWE
jgi:hypothetical protein